MKLPMRVSALARSLRLSAAVPLVLAAIGGECRAGGWHRGEMGRGGVDPRRGQKDFIREGLGPRVLPFLSRGRHGLHPAYPALPFHAEIPPGPGDRLYETGRFPWRRG